MRRKISMIVLLVMGLFISSIGATAEESALEVVASHSILTDVAANVSGGLAKVDSLIPVGADPHTFIPSPSDLTMVAKADLVLINGAGFEESLLDAIEGRGRNGQHSSGIRLH